LLLFNKHHKKLLPCHLLIKAYGGDCLSRAIHRPQKPARVSAIYTLLERQNGLSDNNRLAKIRLFYELTKLFLLFLLISLVVYKLFITFAAF